MFLCYSCLRPQVIIAQEEDTTMTTTLTEQSDPHRDLDARQGALARSATPSGTAGSRCSRAASTTSTRRSSTASSAAAPTSPSITVKDENLAGPPALARLLRRRALPARLVRVDLDQPRRRRPDRRGRARAPRREAARHADRLDLRPRRREDRHLTSRPSIDRTAFGMNWQMELPSGGIALDNEVTLTADLELAKA